MLSWLSRRFAPLYRGVAAPVLLSLAFGACDQAKKTDKSDDTESADDDQEKPKKKKKKKATASAEPTASATASAPPTASATASAGGEPATAPLSKEDFCAQAVEIGEKNMERCPASEKANVPSQTVVKDLKTAKKECSMRVDSPKVEFHGDVAARCIAAAKKRGGKTTFFSLHEIPACRGVLTGNAPEGSPALFPEECATGLTRVKNRCVKPAAKNARCEQYPGGHLGDPDDHTRCDKGLDCFMTKYSADGNEAELLCLEPQPIDARCKLDLHQCAAGSSCYQGKCRELADAGGQCMNDSHCREGMACEIRGGAFGTCAKKPPARETCGD